MSKIDKLSEWLRATVQGGSKAPLAEPKTAPLEPSQHPIVPSKAVQKKGPPIHRGVMRMIPVGGLEEVGKNCMIIEYENDILVVDMGFQFPDEEMFGVDYIIPDIQYLVERKDRIRGILITHAHLDHIGAIPYVLADLGFPPIYGLKLSLGLVQKQLEEFKLLKQARLNLVDNEKVYQFGHFDVEFFRVNHSIPDSMGIFIKSPEGSIIHTGDFKFDFTPADGIPSDIRKMTELGKRGVDILFADSTNATKPGHTISERVVAESLEKAIADAPGRIVIASFASLIGRIQQIIEFAQKHGRKVFLSGGSLVANVEIAHKLGFVKFAKGHVNEIRGVNKFADREVLILTTGGQGEPMAALSRMATGAHAQVKIHPGDTVVVSSSPIIGNEKSVAFLVDSLARLGAKVIHHGVMDVHTSGHGQQEDLKLMMSLTRPRHLVPIHGNFYMRRAHGDLGPAVGIAPENVHMLDNGNVIEITKGKVEMKKEDIKVRFVVVDGEMRGDLGSNVLKEREMMAKNGLITIVIKMAKGKMVGRPFVVTKGFLYQKDQNKILSEIEHKAKEAIEKLSAREKHKLAPQDYEGAVRSEVAGLILRRFDRRPIVNTVVLFA